MLASTHKLLREGPLIVDRDHQRIPGSHAGSLNAKTAAVERNLSGIRYHHQDRPDRVSGTLSVVAFGMPHAKAIRLPPEIQDVHLIDHFTRRATCGMHGVLQV
jgi:hypothetical protein